MIEVSGIAKRFGSHVALEDVSLSVENGMVYGLVGYNGAGKTTLLKIIAGVYKPDAGTVRIDGVPMARRPPESRLAVHRGRRAVLSAAGHARNHAVLLPWLLSVLVRRRVRTDARAVRTRSHRQGSRVLERHAAAAGHPAGVCHWGAHHAFGRKLRRAGPGKAQPAQAASEGVCAGAGRFGYLELAQPARTGGCSRPIWA